MKGLFMIYLNMNLWMIKMKKTKIIFPKGKKLNKLKKIANKYTAMRDICEELIKIKEEKEEMNKNGESNKSRNKKR